jgi:nucleoside-diphosphate kinase
VLAAGRGRRMGGAKHLRPLAGVPLAERVVRALLRTSATRVRLVLAPDDDAGRALATRIGVAALAAEDAHEGRAASVRAAVRAAQSDSRGALFALADQPFLEPDDFERLFDAFRAEPRAIVRASYRGEPGSPVLFPADCFADLLLLRGREGGRQVLERRRERVRLVSLPPEHGRDLDAPEDWPAEGAPLPSAAHMERTFSIVKPDAVRARKLGAILEAIEASGLTIVATKMMQLDAPKAEGFYAVHKERPFFKDLVKFMTSGPVVVSVLEGDDAVARYRKLMGATDPAKADAGTLRERFATNIEQNAVHGSDSQDNAKTEIAYFFSATELVRR